MPSGLKRTRRAFLKLYQAVALVFMAVTPLAAFGYWHYGQLDWLTGLTLILFAGIALALFYVGRWLERVTQPPAPEKPE